MENIKLPCSVSRNSDNFRLESTNCLQVLLIKIYSIFFFSSFSIVPAVTTTTPSPYLTSGDLNNAAGVYYRSYALIPASTPGINAYAKCVFFGLRIFQANDLHDVDVWKPALTAYFPTPPPGSKFLLNYLGTCTAADNTSGTWGWVATALTCDELLPVLCQYVKP